MAAGAVHQAPGFAGAVIFHLKVSNKCSLVAGGEITAPGGLLLHTVVHGEKPRVVGSGGAHVVNTQLSYVLTSGDAFRDKSDT